MSPDPIAEMDKAVRCLAIEVHADVYADVRGRWLRALEEIEKIRSLVGKHDPTGEDHLQEMMEHAERADQLEVELDLAEHHRDRAIQEAAQLRIVLREAFALDARSTHQRMMDAADKVGLDLQRLFLKPEG